MTQADTTSAAGFGTAAPAEAFNGRAAVVLDRVGKAFGTQHALQGIDAVIQPGRLTGLVGPDGAGKTTLMRLMAGLLRPTEGKLTVAGLDTQRDAATLADRVGYMPQRFGLYEDLSVQENLHLYADLRGLPRDAHRGLFAQLLEFTRLAPFTARLAGQLSGGMKQKLGLACALMARPEVLLLDEPGVGVDPVSRQELWRMVQALTDDGMAVVWATAYLDEAERCQQVLLLNEGRLAYAGPPEGLTRRLGGRSLRLNLPGHAAQGADAPGAPRPLLARVLSLPEVCDGVIQGDAVRVVLREGASIDSLRTVAGEVGATVEPVPARFEDAFVDLLGGGPGGTSAIAERMAPVPVQAGTVVECRELTRRFGRFTAADRVSFAVRQGEIFGLLGPNGAGKSTTFKMLCGLLTPSAGQAMVAGLDLRRATAQAKRQLGYMAQKFSLYGLMSVRQNLEFSAGVYGLQGTARRQRVAEMVDTFGLQAHLDEGPDQLPLGFKQRLALACALIHEPPVLFLDEPTSGVDPLTRREFWTHINGLVRKGVTVLVTTHFMDEAEYCDRVALMYRARVIALDTPDGLKRRVPRPAGGDTAPGSEPTMEQAFIHLVQQVDADVAAMEAV